MSSPYPHEAQLREGGSHPASGPFDSPKPQHSYPVIIPNSFITLEERIHHRWSQRAGWMCFHWEENIDWERIARSKFGVVVVEFGNWRGQKVALLLYRRSTMEFNPQHCIWSSDNFEE